MDWLLVIVGVLILIISMVLIYLTFLSSSDQEDKLLSKVSNNILDDEIKSVVLLSQKSGEGGDFEKGLAQVQITHPVFWNLKDHLHKYIIWQDEFVNSLLIGILSSNHILVEWVPGLAKTKTLEVLTRLLKLDFKRLQFTPDMLPSDIIGTQIFNLKTQEFKIQKWPVFTNILLADEINRTTPKVQSALLEAMQEKKVNIGGEEFDLPAPFFVLATQNPIEQEWTYSLPEAQIDRFMFKVLVDYPSFEQEVKILEKANEDIELIKPIIWVEEIFQAKKEIELINVPAQLKRYIVGLVRATRVLGDYVLLWASPRGEIAIYQSAKTLAYLKWKKEVEVDDIRQVALSSLRHRLILSPQAEVEGLKADDLLMQVLPKVPTMI